MTFPTQEQESFFWGHVQAFKHFGGVPHRLSYDNLGTAVKLAFEKTGKAGRPRQEVRAFVAFRSHYLFESHFCTPGQGHEKGQVEHAVGYTRRNALVPLPEAISFEDLNQQLLKHCLKEDSRKVSREVLTIGEAWEQERSLLLAVPPSDYECCDMKAVRLTPYSQATGRVQSLLRASQSSTPRSHPQSVSFFCRDLGWNTTVGTASPLLRTRTRHL